MFLVCLSFLLIHSTTAKIGCPTFNWVSISKSEHGIPLLNIKYPDNHEDDFAVLKKINSTSTTVCLLEGHLMIEENVSVKISKRCDSENDFLIEINSQRLVYSSFNVTNGKANPIIPKEASNAAPGTQIPKPFSFPRNGLILRLVAFYDLSFYTKFGTASTGLIEAITEEAQILFSLPSLTVDIKLELVEVKEINETILSANHDLTTIFERSPLEEGNVTNAFLFFTGKSINRDLKIPRNGSICSTQHKERSAIVSWRASAAETSKDLAKEIGYLLGMADDFKWNRDNSKLVTRFSSKGQTCTSINGIMDYTSEHLVWSTCSVEDFLDYYNTVRGNQPGGQFCVVENPTQPKVSVAYSKVLVAIGNNRKNLVDVEIIDLVSSETTCQNLASFPSHNFRSAGALTFEDRPLICGGLLGDKEACFEYKDRDWKMSFFLNEGRYGFAMTESPYQDGKSKLFVTGDAFSTVTEVLTENGWKKSVPFPSILVYHCMVKVNSTSVLVIGGDQRDGLTSGKSFFFNTETNIWTEGPTLVTARSEHSCGLVRKNDQTEERSVIAAGGVLDGKYHRSVEVLDLDLKAWRYGPNLPFPIFSSVMVEDPSGGVVLIGGYGEDDYLDTLYRLPHVGPGAAWEEMRQKLKNPRRTHTAFLVPDEITECN